MTDKTAPIPPEELPLGRSPWQIVWNKFRKNRIAMIGGWILIFFYFCAIFAGFLAPYSYETQNRMLGFHPPMWKQVHFRDEEGNWRRPFVYGLKGRQMFYEEDREHIYPIRFFVKGDEYSFLGLFTLETHLFGVDDPGRIFLFGADYLGRDILSRILFGSQISLSIGLVGIAISMSVGMLVGGIAGYFGGFIDFILMRLVEVILSIPALYLILIIRGTLPVDLPSTQVYLIMVVILAFIGWASNARVIRGMVLAIKENDYVQAARAIGVNQFTIIVKHILPNTLSYVIVTATLYVPYYILGEVALSFLGVGIQEPQASWGNMLRDAQNVRYLLDFPWIILPGPFIFITVLAFNFLGDGLRDATDPRMIAE